MNQNIKYEYKLNKISKNKKKYNNDKKYHGIPEQSSGIHLLRYFV